ncbi:DUF4440 domain-containing protein [Nonomuraea endophytica]|uniref:DUF4440 domain-containing protein n=1 Tax=Nonomuraea endophytica TaxID=714136 RepID=A0A7W8EHX5_9ACTN|nr:DUF4440 domain-containing protein [Nonomuraea endophytica]MBB5081430.1 hypothetical protein [Nonomuraea endophytica]
MTAREEVVRHHRVIERWLSGEPGQEFAEFERAHADAFTLTGPDGRTLEREQVMRQVRDLRGAAPGLRIEIRDVRVVAESGPLLVAAYQEWQEGGARRSTVVFRRAGEELRWLHLQETWLNPPA